MYFNEQELKLVSKETNFNRNSTYVANGGKTATAVNPNGTRAKDKARV